VPGSIADAAAPWIRKAKLRPGDLVCSRIYKSPISAPVSRSPRDRYPAALTFSRVAIASSNHAESSGRGSTRLVRCGSAPRQLSDQMIVSASLADTSLPSWPNSWRSPPTSMRIDWLIPLRKPEQSRLLYELGNRSTRLRKITCIKQNVSLR